MTDRESIDRATHTTIAEELKKGKSVMCFTVGVSMRPLLRERQTHVMLRPASSAEVNDIVLYLRSNGRYVLHRCRKVCDGYCLIRGDNTYDMEHVDNSQILGVVTHVYRKGRTIDVNASKPYRAYVVFWNSIYYVRYFLWRLLSVAKRVIKKIIGYDKRKNK